MKWPRVHSVETFDHDGVPILYSIAGDTITRVKMVDGRYTIFSLDFEWVVQENRLKVEQAIRKESTP